MTSFINPLEGLQNYTRSLSDMWQQKLAMGAIVTWLSEWIGADAALLGIMLLALCLDFALGVYVAVKRGKFRCYTLTRGVAKLPCYCFYLLVVDTAVYALTVSTGFELPLLNMFVAYLVLTDAASIIAHMRVLGLPMPKLLALIVNSSQHKIEHTVSSALGEDCPKCDKPEAQGKE